MRLLIPWIAEVPLPRGAIIAPLALRWRGSYDMSGGDKMRKAIPIAVLVLGLAAAGLTFSHGEDEEPYFKIIGLSLKGEWIRIQNVDTYDRSIGNWVILSIGNDDSIDQLFRFPFSCVAKAGGIVTVYSGNASANLSNTNDRCWQEDIRLYWDWSGNDPNVWADSGDTACLLNYDRQLVDEYSFKGEGKCQEQY